MRAYTFPTPTSKLSSRGDESKGGNGVNAAGGGGGGSKTNEGGGATPHLAAFNALIDYTRQLITASVRVTRLAAVTLAKDRSRGYVAHTIGIAFSFSCIIFR
jgi:hypothetical protein